MKLVPVHKLAPLKGRHRRMRSVLTQVRVTALHTLLHRKAVKWDATDTALLHVISVGLWHSLVRLARGNDPVKLVFISEFRLWFWI